MTNFKTRRRTPMDQLSAFDFAVIALEDAMRSIREFANEIRTTPWQMDHPEWNTHHRKYLKGKLHGVGFGFSQMLIFTKQNYEEFDEFFTSYMNEADFLFGPYLEQK